MCCARTQSSGARRSLPSRSARSFWEDARRLRTRPKGRALSSEPGPEPTLDETLADQERQRLFRIIEELVKWENTR